VILRTESAQPCAYDAGNPRATWPLLSSCRVGENLEQATQWAQRGVGLPRQWLMELQSGLLLSEKTAIK
jgi:hypothetical protein